MAVLKFIDTLGSIGFLLVCLAAGLLAAMLWPKRRRAVRVWLAGVGLVYVAMALPVVAHVIAGRLPAVSTATPASLPKLDRLVVFDGDNRRGRVREALAIDAVARPAVVTVLGNPWISEKLMADGLPSARLDHEEMKGTTRDQIAWLANFTRHSPLSSAAVVVSRLQAPRVAALMRQAGLTCPLVASPIDNEPPTEGARLWVPTYIALRVSRDALYEHAALVYYRWRGWIAE